MARKKLEHLFLEINYSNDYESELKNGFIILDKYLSDLGICTISEEKKIKDILSNFLSEIRFPEIKNSERDYHFLSRCYEEAIKLLEEIYHYKEDLPIFTWSNKYDFFKPKFSIKTEQEVINIIQTGRKGGINHILKTIVYLHAKYMSDLHVEWIIAEYLIGKSYEEECEIADEYVKKFGEYLPKNSFDFELNWFVQFYLKKILIEHPKMMHRLGKVIEKDIK